MNMRGGQDSYLCKGSIGGVPVRRALFEEEAL